MPHSSYSRPFLDSASLAGGMLFSRHGAESRVLKATASASSLQADRHCRQARLGPRKLAGCGRNPFPCPSCCTERLPHTSNADYVWVAVEFRPSSSDSLLDSELVHLLPSREGPRASTCIRTNAGPVGFGPIRVSLPLPFFHAAYQIWAR